MSFQLTDADQDLYKNFPLVISERWQNEVAETVFETINFEADKAEHKKKAKQKKLFDLDEKESDCILHGYIKKLGGPWTSSWQMRYAKLYPNRLELHPDSAKPEMVFMDQVEEVSPELVQVKNEQCIVVRMRDGKIVLTNPVSVEEDSNNCSRFSVERELIYYR
jgi:beta-adrenergic-receptor kinase